MYLTGGRDALTEETASSDPNKERGRRLSAEENRWKNDKGRLRVGILTDIGGVIDSRILGKGKGKEDFQTTELKKHLQKKG